MGWANQRGFKETAKEVDIQNKASKGFKRFDERQEFRLGYGESVDIIFLDTGVMEDLPHFVTHEIQPVRSMAPKEAYRSMRKAFCTRDFGRCYLCEQAIKEQNMDSSSKQVKMPKAELFLNILIVTPYTYTNSKGETITREFRKQVLKLTQSNQLMKTVEQILKAKGTLRGSKIRLSRPSKESNPQSPRTGMLTPYDDFKTVVQVSEDDLHKYKNKDILKNDKGEITMGEDYYYTPFDFYGKYPEPSVESVTSEFGMFLTDVNVAEQHRTHQDQSTNDSSSPIGGDTAIGEDLDDEIPF